MVEELAQASMLDAELAGAAVAQAAENPSPSNDAESLKQQMAEIQRAQAEMERRYLAEQARAEQAQHAAEVAERRRVETERWANEQSMKRAEAERAANAIYQQTQQQNQLAPPPGFRPEEFDSLLADPAKFQGYVAGNAEYAYNLARAQTAQEVAALRQQFAQELANLRGQIGTAMQPVLGMGMTQAEQAAEQELTNAGHKPEDFRAALPAIRESLTNAAKSSGDNRVAMNPDAYVMAYAYQKIKAPVSPGRQEPPLSLKSDAVTPNTPGKKVDLNRSELADLGKIREALGPEIAAKVYAQRKAGKA